MMERKLAGVVVLVVDDEQPIATALARTLEQEGASAMTCGTTHEALGLIENLDPTPDVVVVDVQLHGTTDGVWLMQHILDTWDGIGVVCISGYPRPPGVVCAFLQKPPDTFELIETVRKAASR